MYHAVHFMVHSNLVDLLNEHCQLPLEFITKNFDSEFQAINAGLVFSNWCRLGTGVKSCWKEIIAQAVI